MNHQFEYKGIHCSADVYEEKDGQWTWFFQIGEETICKCTDLPMDREEFALSEVIRKVKWMIDHKKFLTPLLHLARSDITKLPYI